MSVLGSLSASTIKYINISDLIISPINVRVLSPQYTNSNTNANTNTNTNTTDITTDTNSASDNMSFISTNIDISNENNTTTDKTKSNNNNIQYTELVNNIRLYGLLNPLTVVYNASTNNYEIIAGIRRFSAVCELGYTTVQCNVLPDTINENDQVIISLTENMHRSNMTLGERVKTYCNLIHRYKKQYEHQPHINSRTDNTNDIFEKLAKDMCVSVKSIKTYSQLSHFPDAVLDKLDAKGNEKITLEFAVQLSKLNITDENDLLNIIDNVFMDVKSTDRCDLIKTILTNEKFNDYGESHQYIKKITQIKTQFVKDLEQQQIEKKTKEDNYKQFLQEQDDKKRRNDINVEPSPVQIPKLEPLHIEPIPSIVKIYTDNTDNTDNTINENKFNELKKQTKTFFTVQKTSILNPPLYEHYSNSILDRYNKKCIISSYDDNACNVIPIIPITNKTLFDINNGILLNGILTKLFEKQYWSINPDTLCVEIINNDNNIISKPTYDYLCIYNKQYTSILKSYPNTIKYMTEHYNKFRLNISGL